MLAFIKSVDSADVSGFAIVVVKRYIYICIIRNWMYWALIQIRCNFAQLFQSSGKNFGDTAISNLWYIFLDKTWAYYVHYRRYHQASSSIQRVKIKFIVLQLSEKQTVEPRRISSKHSSMEDLIHQDNNFRQIWVRECHIYPNVQSQFERVSQFAPI